MNFCNYLHKQSQWVIHDFLYVNTESQNGLNIHRQLDCYASIDKHPSKRGRRGFVGC